MEPIGKDPYWQPETMGDRVLVGVFHALFVVFYAPLRLLARVLGWTKINWALLDVLSVPGKALLLAGSLFGRRGRAWGLKANALEHTEFVCRLCPASRQAQRDPLGKGACAWNRRWNNGDFAIDSDFGPRNYLLQYVGRTDLTAYRSLAEAQTLNVKGTPRRTLPAYALWTVSLAFWALLVGLLVAL